VIPVGNPVLQRLVDERGQTQENIDRILDRANEEERDPSESERELINGHRERLQQLEPMIGELLEVEETRGQARDARAALSRTRRGETTEGDGNGDGDGDGNGGEEPPDGEYQTFARYARDVILTRFNHIGASVPAHQRHQAQERLQRAVQQVLTADVGPLIQPQYINQIMQVIDNSRPLVDASNRVTLSSGKLEWPHIVERPTVGEQATEKTEAGDGTLTVDVLNTVAKTYLVAANFSWQTVQWSNPDAMRLWFDLAAADYAKKTDAAAGAVLAAADTTPTVVASGDLEGWMAAIAAASGEVYANTGRFPNAIAANPADAFTLLGFVSQVAPVFLTTGQGNLSTGTFPPIGGLRFIATNGLPAGTAIVGDFSALLCAETAGSPVELRAVEPSIGGIEVGIIGAFACAITDPGAFAEITAPAVGP
jgi:HK97 family phage major capsid protein